jgi:uncharacterized heparinase superfamily protein
MYHSILLFRILDCINVLKNNDWRKDDLLPTIEEKASKMLAWLGNILFKNGQVPMVNDSAHQIAPPVQSLFEYAGELGVPTAAIPLLHSGYRMIRTGSLEFFIDIGNIGPDYIPGHAHSDTFSFELYQNGNPLIVDVGTSTYEKNQLRQTERSTHSHNTVVVNDNDQSEVWDGFRVGRRARIIKKTEEKGMISAAHDGYKKDGFIHQRVWLWRGDELTIRDTITGDSTPGCAAYFHFHPTLKIKIENETIMIGSSLTLQCNGHSSLEIENYDYSVGFNLRQPAKVLKVNFTNTLETLIRSGLDT